MKCNKPTLRHPEKAHKPDNPQPSKPDWIRARAPQGAAYEETLGLMKGLKLNTVCEEAACPNIGECWKRKHATFMIMGAVCSRACAFCNVATGKPTPLDPDEPNHVAEAAARLKLKHVVVTSVTRDDLPDGGAAHFAKVVKAIRDKSPSCTIELLTPDFRNKWTVEKVARGSTPAPCHGESAAMEGRATKSGVKSDAVEIIVRAKPDVFGHNLETVPRLYPAIRKGARYFTSLRLLQRVKELDAAIFTKSGLMVGLGETAEEIGQVMDDLRSADVDFITLGQYLQPTPKHAAVERFVTPEEFDSYAAMARAKGFKMVSASPLTRSSYHADEDFEKLKASRA